MGGKGSGGRNRKSIEDHHRDHTFRKDRHGKLLLAEWSSKIEKTVPKCPKWFDKIAKKEWNRVAPELHRLGLLTILDHAILEGYCISYSMFVRASREIGESFVYDFVEGKSLRLKRVKKPEVQIANDTLNQIRLLCREFGLDLNAGRIVLPGEKEKPDSFNELLKYCNESTAKTDK